MDRKGEAESEWHAGQDGVRRSLHFVPSAPADRLRIHSCPLSESSETYQHMASDLKLTLFSRLEALAPEYGLHDLIVPSFVRKSGYKTDLAAADAVEALGALLEVATGVRLDFGSAVGGRRGGRGQGGTGQAEAASANGGREEWKDGLRDWVGKGDEGEGSRAAAVMGAEGEDEDGTYARERREREQGLRNFWLAWDALDHE